jgi:hypothetical protein
MGEDFLQRASAKSSSFFIKSREYASNDKEVTTIVNLMRNRICHAELCE